MDSFSIVASKLQDKYFNFHYFFAMYNDIINEMRSKRTYNYFILCPAVNVV